MTLRVKVCYNHSEYRVPLIYTYSFPGAEYWCPYCGYTSGVFGAGGVIEVDDEELKVLEVRLEKYKELSKDFLHAQGVGCCTSTMYKGKRIKPQDLPQAEKDRLDAITWETGRKAEDYA